MKNLKNYFGLAVLIFVFGIGVGVMELMRGGTFQEGFLFTVLNLPALTISVIFGMFVGSIIASAKGVDDTLFVILGGIVGLSIIYPLVAALFDLAGKM
ncbi:MAG: hypothetical protein A3D16_08340 [Rhodobacterales bacterium RIFCSPHIGHO2_02_FULL_62_130]|nr:MAG: hypothetical protein A3D16_08340 [Rhodobacterales bacterium RIFCSPHIGHO2_02_FULL_62_130]OHC60894.1 MAG: hypothetical protein A3E48_14465 [Rhodobacterales bacterium RIFCSPHIGHO2_12_FULL_62_75]HCY99279.1 hypothetical protein [Rhodobacter sp.]